MTAPHPAVAANRSAKARRFVAFLDEMIGRDLVTTPNLPTVNWAKVAEHMGEQPPSTDTIAAIRWHVRGRDAYRASKADPFAGLPA